MLTRRTIVNFLERMEHYLSEQSFEADAAYALSASGEAKLVAAMGLDNVPDLQEIPGAHVANWARVWLEVNVNDHGRDISDDGSGKYIIEKSKWWTLTRDDKTQALATVMNPQSDDDVVGVELILSADRGGAKALMTCIVQHHLDKWCAAAEEARRTVANGVVLQGHTVPFMYEDVPGFEGQKLVYLYETAEIMEQILSSITETNPALQVETESVPGVVQIWDGTKLATMPNGDLYPPIEYFDMGYGIEFTEDACSN